MFTVNSERMTPDEYLSFLTRTDLGSQYPEERFEERIVRLLENVNVSLAARDENGLLIGALLGLSDFAYWLYVTDLGVDRDHTRQGIGSALMKRAHTLCGGERDIVVCLTANSGAIPFYEKLGMYRAGDMMKYDDIDRT